MTLNEYLKAKNLSPEQFARENNLPARSVRNWFYGIRIPRRDQMAQIYEATGGMVSPNDFFGVGQTAEGEAQ